MKLRMRLALGFAAISLATSAGLFATATSVLRRSYKEGIRQRRLAANEAVDRYETATRTQLRKALDGVDRALSRGEGHDYDDPVRGAIGLDGNRARQDGVVRVAGDGGTGFGRDGPIGLAARATRVDGRAVSTSGVAVTTR